MENDRFIQRAVTDEVMYEIMRLSGQEYVDMYATAAKRQIADAAKRKAEAERAERAAREEARRAAGEPPSGPAARLAAARRKWHDRDRAA
jgi:1-acyl-sn-glycerol-3-phosphate acyltransferase